MLQRRTWYSDTGRAMSKRPRAASGSGRGRKVAPAAEPVEVINLLDDSSESEDDPDDAAIHARQAQANPAVGAARPSKRLRRMDAANTPPRSKPAAPSTGAGSAAGGRRAATAVITQQQQQQQQPEKAPSSQRDGPKLRQATLPVASLRPRAGTLPLQALNISRPRIHGPAAPAASNDSAFVGIGGGSPAPSASPSLSQRSSRMSQDPDFTLASQSVSHRGASQSSASQQHNQKRQEPSQPQRRQLTFAPARTGPATVVSMKAEGAAAMGPRDGAGHSGNQAVAAVTATMDRVCPAPPATGPSGSMAACTGGLQTIATAAAAAAPSTHPARPAAEMWYERHAPRSEEDLVQVLHRKKVLEVKDWLEHQRHVIIAAGKAAVAQPPRPYISGTQYQQTQHQYQPHHHPQDPTQPGAWQPRPPSSQAWPGGTGGGGGSGVAPGLGILRPRCGLAVLSGPAGCGKSACLRVLAEAAGFDVVEWTPPPPVMWREYQYQRSAGGDKYGSEPSASYQSKLDDFEAFVSRSKYPSLVLSAAPTVAGTGQESAAGSMPRTGGGQPLVSQATRVSAAAASRSKLLLVEDLPHTHDAERRQRLAAALRDLAACARGPVVLVATEAEGQAAGGGGGQGRGAGGGGIDGGDSMGGAKGLHKDILAALQSAGATVISFNPVTSNNIAKLLLKVAAAEGVDMAPAAAVGLAEAADGDVRSALQALQMNAMLQKAALAAAAAAGRGGGRRGAAGGGKGSGGRGGGKGGGKGGASMTATLRTGRQQALTPGEVARLAAAQRDLGLPLFHALGKFLHNKRGGEALQGGGGGGEGNGYSEGDDDGGGGGGGAAARCRGAGGGGGKDKREKDSVALRQLNAHVLATGRQWKLQHEVQLPARLLRLPMRYDPEAIMLRCGLEAPVLLSFLHENYLGFMDEGRESAVDDVATVATYLSDSAFLCGQSRSASATAATASGGTSLWLEDSPAAANLSSAIAASVAARGLMYGNTHPAPHRFNPIRAPASSAIDQAAAANRLQLRGAACRLAEAGRGGGGAGTGAGAASVQLSCCGGSGSASQLVSSVMSWLRSLAQTSPHHAVWLAPLLPGSWSYYWNGSVTEGAFLRRVAALPSPPQLQHPQFQQHQFQQRGGEVALQPQQQGGGVEGMLEQLGLEDEDPIEG